MEHKEDAYSNRSSLTTDRRCFGYPANPFILLILTAMLTGAQLRSLTVCAAVIVCGLLALRVLCEDDPKGIAVWIYVSKRRMRRRIAFLAADIVADKPFIFTE